MDQVKQALVARVAAEAALPVADPVDFAQRYFRAIGMDDLTDHSPGELARMLSGHVAAGRVRAVGEDIVAVDPAGSLDIVTDDMAFLVDSITGHLHRASIDITLLVHPQLGVARDGSGVLLGLAGPGEGLAESWMHIEVAPLTPDQAQALPGALSAVLRDVRVAVQDWQAMRGRALEVADGLTVEPPAGVGETEVSDAVELLRWLADDNFTFVGYREYGLSGTGADATLVADPGTALGVMRDVQAESVAFASLSPEAREIALAPHLLALTKANRRSTVHRTVYLDYVGVKRFDESGRVVGEHRFLGLYAATAYAQSVTEVPVLRRKVALVVEQLGLPADSHDGRDLMEFLETYPRDELFEIRVEQLAQIAEEVLRMQDRRQTRVFLRYDDFGRFVSAMVYLPRDRYTTSVRERMQAILRAAFSAESVDFTARVSESVLARLHFLTRGRSGGTIPHVDVHELEEQLAEAAKSWDDRFAEAVESAGGGTEVVALSRRYAGAFPEAYKEDFGASVGLADAERIASLTPDDPMSVQLYTPPGGASGERRLKVFRLGAAMSLSEMLPILQELGVGVVDERPYSLRAAGEQAWIYDFGLTMPRLDAEHEDTLAARFESAFVAAWEGMLVRDGFLGLVVAAGLTWRQAALVQALMAYARQLGTSFSQRYSEQVLCGHGSLVHQIVEVFEQRLDPDAERSEEASAALVRSARARLDAIASLDEDRIVRTLLTIVLAVVRTNYFQVDALGAPPPVISVKVLPRSLPEAPEPRPAYEIWVYSPRVEGVHLRFGQVARGGLRWSDRREDVRTEVLGLVKAQMVKNAVIVPVGAKGGFVCLTPPDPSDREAWQAEGIACYQLFVSALLDITDNLVAGEVVPPARTVRLDGDDPYLVVAADKGTATFSDIANALSLERRFWLGDAFASGGSAGYDHKAMGITARGAWESVKRHFLQLGVDVQTQDFTVAGIGDMSGDVFGNGMLLSEHIRLVAAFDHRHVFLDPEPDAARTFAERRRLFDLPRSSWEDFDPALISEGGGVFPRSAKSIPISAQVRARLGLPDDVVELAPNALLRAIVCAPVDLLWNGGIGTYVKATSESNLEVGDKANDGIRVNGAQLRCRVVGEGGNLGFTQLGRVEAATAAHVMINTDAIDNSAGVDTSDHEVNIKILLDAAVRDGSLTADERLPLLESMTDDVGLLVLRDNYEQNLLLATDVSQSPSLVVVHRRMIDDLVARGEVDRGLDALPSDAELRRRAEVHEGLVSPELSMLLAHVKIALTADLLPSRMSQEPWFARLLRTYFPGPVVERFGDRLTSHPLSNEIVTTMVSNAMVNNGGTTYAFRAAEETGATAIDIARAYLVATEVFDLPALWERIESLDGVASPSLQFELLLESRRLLDRATRWTIQTRGHSVDVDAEVAVLRAEVRRLAPLVPGMLRGGEAQRLRDHVAALVLAGAPEGLAQDVCLLLDLFSLLDVVEVARRVGEDPARVADLYFAVSERFGGDLLLHRITALPRPDRWSALARAALRSDLYTALAALTARISRATSPAEASSARIDRWEAGQPEGVTRARGTLAEITALDSADIATLSVALRALRALVAQGGTAAASDPLADAE